MKGADGAGGGERAGRLRGVCGRPAVVGVGLVAAVGIAFGAGLTVGRRSGAGDEAPPAAAYEIREGRHSYINPLLECEIADQRLNRLMRPFGDRLNRFAEAREREGRSGDISVYYRDLNNGPWFGRRVETRYYPASLAKVPIVIACFRHAEANAGFLARKIVYEGLEEERQPGFLNPESNLTRGGTYTVDELIQRVAMYSDNAAAKLLARALPPRLLQQVYFDLGIDPQRLADPGFALSPKEFGAFFRVLYNATYLTKAFSERALQYFDRSTFELGLVAGVPAGTPVSHKFGVWETPSPGGRNPFQLHDCGIVYHPQRPYLLCVMTSGSDYVRMSSDIAAISRFVYEEIDDDLRRPAPGTPDLPPPAP